MSVASSSEGQVADPSVIVSKDGIPIVPEEKKSKQIGHYILGKKLGEGTFGKVKLATHIFTNEKVAVKILEKDRIIDVSDVERVSREIHILKLLRHSNIIQLYEIIETPKQLFIIMEYASGGELFDYIVANQRVKEREAARFFLQIISGIEYIHRLNIVHRDLKPENLLLNHDKSIKIVDFGLSNTYKKNELLKTACGSPCYAAPEMIAGKRYHGLGVDIWSCGVILYALLCGYLPFEDPDTKNLYKKILRGEFTVLKTVSNEAKDLLKNILHTDPTKRYTVDQIRAHPWCSQNRLTKTPEGIIVGYNLIPIDHAILKQLKSFHFDTELAQKCIEANKHNHITTCYYLLLKKHLATGAKSIADISADDFDSSILLPFKRPPKTPNQDTFRGTEDLLDNKENDISQVFASRKQSFEQPRQQYRQNSPIRPLSNSFQINTPLSTPSSSTNQQRRDYQGIPVNNVNQKRGSIVDVYQSQSSRNSSKAINQIKNTAENNSNNNNNSYNQDNNQNTNQQHLKAYVNGKAADPNTNIQTMKLMIGMSAGGNQLNGTSDHTNGLKATTAASQLLHQNFISPQSAQVSPVRGSYAPVGLAMAVPRQYNSSKQSMESSLNNSPRRLTRGGGDPLDKNRLKTKENGGNNGNKKSTKLAKEKLLLDTSCSYMNSTTTPANDKNVQRMRFVNPKKPQQSSQQPSTTVQQNPLQRGASIGKDIMYSTLNEQQMQQHQQQQQTATKQQTINQNNNVVIVVGKNSGQIHAPASTLAKLNSTATTISVSNSSTNKPTIENRGKSTEPYSFESEINMSGYRVQENYCNKSLTNAPSTTTAATNNNHNHSRNSSQKPTINTTANVLNTSIAAQNKSINLSNCSFDASLKEAAQFSGNSRTPAGNANMGLQQQQSRQDKQSPAHRRGKSSPLSNIMNKLDKMKLFPQPVATGDSYNRTHASHNTSFSATSQNHQAVTSTKNSNSSNYKQNNIQRKFNY